jgi:hypothetical protein
VIAGKSNITIIYPGDNIQTVYDSVKTSATSTSWEILLLTDGKYEPASMVTMDTPYTGIASVSGNPESCILYGNFATAVLTQSADNIVMSGIKIYNANTTKGTLGTDAACGLIISATNASSVYRDLILDVAGAGVSSGYSCSSWSSVTMSGTWYNCNSGDYGWRVAKDQSFNPRMYNCTAGTYSYGGDGDNDDTTTGSIGGVFYCCESGNFGFGGCTAFGMDIAAGAKFYFCIAGERSFGLGSTCGGTFYNCVGGLDCFGGYAAGTFYGTFSGTAYDCVATDDSFGGGPAGSVLSGNLYSCRVTGMTNQLRCTGARVENSYISSNNIITGTVILNDSASTLYNTTIVSPGIASSSIDTDSDGTGRTAAVGHCRSNKDFDGDITNSLNGVTGAGGYVGAAMGIMDSDIE